MKIYLAARFGRREELRAYAEQLEEAGHQSASGWLYAEEPDEEDGGMRALTDHERAHFAVVDMQDVAKCDVLIAFTEEEGTKGGSRGGRHVEFGAAIAMNKDVAVVGPRENIFHWLPNIPQYESFDKALKALEGRR